MPNLYATPGEIKDIAPDNLRASVTKYDDALLRLLNTVSRWVDRWTGRRFYPISEKRYFTAVDGEVLLIDDLVTVTSLKADEDGDRTYETTWATTDYDLMPYNAQGSYHKIAITPNGDNSFPTKVERGVEIDGVWAKTDDRAAMFEDTGQDVQDNPMASGATSLTVTDIDGDDRFGISPVIALGMLLRIDSEYFETTATNSSTDIATVIGARNGTTAAAHNQNTDVEVFRPPDPVKQAVVIQAVRQLERAAQGYGDTRATPELGEMFILKRIDPEAQELLESYRRLVLYDETEYSGEYAWRGV